MLKSIPLTGAACCGLFLGLLMACDSTSTRPAEQQQAATPEPAILYENMLVRRPGSAPEDGKVYLVRDREKHWVVDAAWFSTNGFRFPEDVREISGAELAAIPTGEPIQ